MLTNYPKVQMSTEQLDALQEALLLKIEMQRNEDVKPKFAKCSYKQGYLALDCKDQITANWLKDVTGSLSPWDNAELIALDVKDIPRPDTFHAFFPLSADFSDERLKGLIESQNDGLSTNGWKILNRTNANKHAEWLLNVDEDSLAILSKRNFVLNFRFGETQLRKVKNLGQRNSDTETNSRQKTINPSANEKSQATEIPKTNGKSGYKESLSSTNDRLPIRFPEKATSSKIFTCEEKDGSPAPRTSQVERAINSNETH